MNAHVMKLSLLALVTSGLVSLVGCASAPPPPPAPAPTPANEAAQTQAPAGPETEIAFTPDAPDESAAKEHQAPPTTHQVNSAKTGGQIH